MLAVVREKVQERDCPVSYGGRSKSMPNRHGTKIRISLTSAAYGMRRSREGVFRKGNVSILSVL